MNREVLLRLLKYIRKYRCFVIISVLCAVISVIASLIGPLIIGKAIDRMAGAGNVDFAAIAKLFLILAFTYACVSIFGWLLTYLTNRIAYQSVNDMRRELFDKTNTLPLKFFDSNTHGDIISRFVNDMDAISDGMLQGLSTLLTGIVTIAGAIGFMVSINPFMTVTVLLSAPASYLVARFITKRSQQMFREQAKTLGKLNGYVEEMISGQKVVKAFSYEKRSYEQFKEINNHLYTAGVKAQFYSSLTNPTTRLVNNVTYAVVGIIGSIAAILGNITIGGISSFVIYANLFAKPFNEITGVLTQIQAALASAQRVFNIMDAVPQTPDGRIEFDSRHSSGKIAFENVCFSYDAKRPLITNFNLDVKPGTRIAIAGQTGAGKTTLVNLLMRFYDVDSGAILIDGVNINTVTRNSLRRSFGMVLQDTWLFAGSIRDNIAYGKTDATDEEIVAAAKAADAHSFIRRLPNGYDTLITDAGDNLSQGQKQLLTIARVMLADPPVLILDEATSNIDTRTEIRIQKAFQKITENRTSFIIAHRLSTIREADLILLMEKGNIAEKGTHEQLLKSNGLYAKLYYSQFEPVQ